MSDPKNLAALCSETLALCSAIIEIPLMTQRDWLSIACRTATLARETGTEIYIARVDHLIHWTWDAIIQNIVDRTARMTWQTSHPIAEEIARSAERAARYVTETRHAAA